MATAPAPSHGWEEKQALTNVPAGDSPKKGASAASGGTVGKRISIVNAEPVSIWKRIAGNSYFESTTMGVIVFNAMWIGIDTEWNHANMKENGKLPLEPASIIIENLFCVYFTMEVTIRFLAFKPKTDCFFDAWFVFDSVLVFFMILETWIMAIVEAVVDSDGGSGVGPLSALRLLRLLRLARVGRLMRFVPELGKLVKGMVKAARSVIFILIFLVLVMYVFAIIFTGTFSDHETYPLTPYCRQWTKHGLPVGPPEENGTEGSEGCLQDGEFGELGQDLFATMGDSIMTLFTRGVLGDNLDETVTAILEQSLALFWLWMIFLIITFATLLNMLIGVVCEVISDAAAEEEENETVSNLKGTIQEAFLEIDENQDAIISKEEWENIKDNVKVRKSFASIGIDDARMEERLQQMQEMLFDDDEDEDLDVDPLAMKAAKGLNLNQLIQKVVEIRPDQNASALDLELLKAQVTKEQKNFMTKLRKIEEGVKQLLGAVAGGDDKAGGGGGQPDMPGMPPLPSMDDDDEDELKLEDVPTAMLFQCLKDRAEPGFVEGTQARNIIHR